MLGAIVFGTIVLLAGAVAIFATHVGFRSIAYALMAAAMALFVWSAAGHPRPILGCVHGTLAGYMLDEPRIYLWVVGADGPVTYTIGYEQQIAQALQEAAEKANAHHTTLDYSACPSRQYGSGAGGDGTGAGSRGRPAGGLSALMESGGMVVEHPVQPMPAKTLEHG